MSQVQQYASWALVLARWVTQYARWVALVWLVIALVCAAVAPWTLARLEKGSGEIAGSQATAVRQKLRTHFDGPPADRLVLVLETRLVPVSHPAIQALMKRVPEVIRPLTGLGQVAGPFQRSDLIGGTPSPHHRTWLLGFQEADSRVQAAAVEHVRQALAPLRDALAVIDSEGLLVVTGGAAVAEDIGQRAKVDGQRAEAIALPLTLLALWLAFRAAGAALLPLVCATVAIALTFAWGYPVTALTPLSNLLENVVTMLGLALGIDYALLLVERWREERRTAADASPVFRAVAYSAPTIVLSGVSVMCGMGALSLAPLLELRSLAFGGVAVVLASVLVALTLLPALLVLLGQRVEWPSSPAQSLREHPLASRWGGMARMVLNHPRLAVVTGTAVMVLLTLPAFSLRTGAPTMSNFPPDMESSRGVAALNRMGAGQLTFDISLVIETTDGSAILERRHLKSLHQFVRAVEADQRILRVLGPLSLRPEMSRGEVVLLWHDWRRTLERFPEVSRAFVSGDRQKLTLTLIPRQGVPPQQVQALVRELRTAPLSGPFQIWVGGQPEDLNALEERLAETSWQVLGMVALGTVGFLGMAFRSLLVPIKAVLLNLLSVGAGFGVITAVCQWGWGAAWIGLQTPLEHIPPFLPLLIFCCVFGLSMDYEIFVLSRVRERLRLHGDQRAAIVEALEATGPVISHAASVMLIIFGAFAGADLVIVKVLGLGLATAVFVDAVVIRTLLTGPLLLLAGRWNWWPGNPSLGQSSVK